MELHDQETAWQIWSLMEATGWNYLPRDGGLLDQPEALMEDVLKIASAYQRIRDMREGRG